ncbi:MAG: arginase family protein [Acidimicrobiales bacterium]|jgi:arginase
MTGPEVAVIGVASSAGTHHAGQERAPAALPSAGLVERLRSAGVVVVDRGDVVESVFAPDDFPSTARSLDRVVEVATAAADAVSADLGEGRLPLVLGGDCTITLGVMAGVLRHHSDAGLLYFDGDADLATPGTTSSGVLDAMGIAHLLGLADNALSRLGPCWPLLADERLVLFGYEKGTPETHLEVFLAARPALARFADVEVRADPVTTARQALARLQESAGHLIVHFDVDAVDSRDLPLANFPHYGTGVPLVTAGEALVVFLGAPELAAVVLTEINPSYEPSGRALARYVETVGGALATCLGNR